MWRMKSDKQPPGESQLRTVWYALTALALALIVSLIVGTVWGVSKMLALLGPVLWPLAIATILSYLLDPAVSWLERRRISRAWGIVIVFFAVVCIFGGLLGSVIPQIIKETNKLVTKIPVYTAQAKQRLSEWSNHAEKSATTPSGTNSPPATNSPPRHGKSSPDPGNSNTNANTNTNTNSNTNVISPEVTRNIHELHNQIMASATDWTGKALSKIGAWALSQLAKATALVDVLIALILIPVYTFYFLREKRWITEHWTNYLPIRDSHAKDEIVFIILAINQYMIAFFRGQVLVSICSGILYTIGFLCIGLDYAFLLGFICTLFTMIPFLGAIINCILALLLTAMQFGDWFHPLMIIVIFAVVVTLENFFYSPRIMGNRVGMHPAVVIVAVMLGITLLGGVLGGVLAIPLAAALRVMMLRYLWKRPKEAEKILA